MKRIGIILCGICLVVVAGCSKQHKPEYARIVFMVGDVALNNVDARIGGAVKQTDIIKTGRDSFCDVKVGGSIIRVKEKSEVSFARLIHSGAGEKTTLGLKIGKMLCKPKKLLKSDKFMVKTPTAVAAVRGTQFIVQADAKKSTMVKVFGGKIRIAKRIRQFDSMTDKLMDVATTVSRQEKVVISRDEVDAAQKAVDAVINREKKIKKTLDLSSIIKKSIPSITIARKKITKFSADDYLKDSREIIAVKEKPKKVMRLIVRAIKKEKVKPKPDGTLLITDYEVYFIKKGKIWWEGKLKSKYIKKDGNIYIATGNYIFCARQKDGQVMWRKNMANDGTVEIRDGKLVIKNKNEEQLLDLDTGQQL